MVDCINNNYKPIKKTFIITNDNDSFNKKIFKDIKNKKKYMYRINVSGFNRSGNFISGRKYFFLTK
jgi:hypothetical protein